MNQTSEESAAQRQARIRRERREAKIKAGGSARLDKITNVSGRIAEPSPTNPPPPDTISASTPHDPEEIDISTLRSSATPFTEASPNQDQIRQFLRSTAPRPSPSHGSPNNSFGTSSLFPSRPKPLAPQNTINSDNDPMMGLLQQLLGSDNGSGDGGGPNAESLPPGLAALLGRGTSSPTSEPMHDAHAGLWTALHVFLALAFGLYITLLTPFTGARYLPPFSHSASEFDIDPSIRLRSLFWAFVTAELGIILARILVERTSERERGSGGLWGFVERMAPQPWAGWIGLVRRYVGVLGGVWRDGMVVVFVLGWGAWVGGRGKG